MVNLQLTAIEHDVTLSIHAEIDTVFRMLMPLLASIDSSPSPLRLRLSPPSEAPFILHRWVRIEQRVLPLSLGGELKVTVGGVMGADSCQTIVLFKGVDVVRVRRLDYCSTEGRR